MIPRAPPNALDLYRKALPGKQEQLTLATSLAADPRPLLDAFRRTVTAFGDYDNLGAFHAAPIPLTDTRWPPRRTADIAAKVAEVGGLAAPRPLRYLDRELGAYAGLVR